MMKQLLDNPLFLQVELPLLPLNLLLTLTLPELLLFIKELPVFLIVLISSLLFLFSQKLFVLN